MAVPIPTPIYRILHVDNLAVLLRRGGAHAPNATPDDGLAYKPVHNVEIQEKRQARAIPCGPGGVIHDYVSFYFGPRSPMLFQLHTGWVPGYSEGQGPLLYVVSSAQLVCDGGHQFVFSDGHGIALFTKWYDDLNDLSRVDWEAVCARMWKDTVDDPDRQRRKQAEFLVRGFFPWSLVQEVAVIDGARKAQVKAVLAAFPAVHQPVVAVRRDWYY